MENFPKNESTHDEKTAWKKLREQVKAIGVILPLVANQANAVEQNADTTKISEPPPVESVFKTDERYESFGEKQNFSPEEWTLFQLYRAHARFGDKERITTYGVLDDGKVVQIPGETMLEANGGASRPEIQISQLEKMYPGIKIKNLHHHPIKPTYGELATVITTIDPEIVNGENTWEQIEQHIQDSLEKIKSGEMLASWPPSSVDIRMMIENKKLSFSVVDGCGVWTFGIDTDTEMGQILNNKGDRNEIIAEKLNELGWSDDNQKYFLSVLHTIARDKNYIPDESIREKLEKFTADYIKTKKETAAFLAGDLDQILNKEYRQHQTMVVHPQTDVAKWRDSINTFISYGKSIGLKISYTPFPPATMNVAK